MFGNKKEEYTVEIVGHLFLDAAYVVAKGMIDKNKNVLKDIGINKFDNETLIELTILGLYIRIKCIEKYAPISLRLKESLIQSMKKSYNWWIKESFTSANDSEYYKYFNELLSSRIKTYEKIYNLIDNKDKDFIEAGMEAGEILFITWERILSTEKSIKNIFDTAPLFDFFINKVMQIFPATVEFIKNIKIK